MPTAQLPAADSDIRPSAPVDHETVILVTPDQGAPTKMTHRGEPSDLGDVSETYGKATDEIVEVTSDRIVDEPAGDEASTPMAKRFHSIVERLSAGLSAILSSNALNDPEPGTDADPRSLIMDSAALLGARARAVIDLSVRQGLPDAEVGAIVGIRQEIAAQTIARTRERVEQALSISVLVKTRVSVCPDLRRVVGAHARASLESSLVDVVNAHLEQCADCASVWSRIPPPLDLLRRPPVAAPAKRIRDRIWERIARRRPWETLEPRIRTIGAAAVATVLALVLGVAMVVTSSGPEIARSAEAVDIGTSAPSVENLARARSPFPRAAGSTATTTPHPVTTVVAARPAPTPPPPSTTVVPSEPPLVVIITPINGQRFDTPSGFVSIDLVAVVQDDIDDGLQVNWDLDSTHLGSGNAITVSSAIDCPDTMTYNVSATVTDSSANTTQQNVTFSVGC